MCSCVLDGRSGWLLGSRLLWGGVGRRGGGWRSLLCIPGGLGNQSCEVKKLCCAPLCCGLPAIRWRGVGWGAACGPAGRPRAAGASRPRYRPNWADLNVFASNEVSLHEPGVVELAGMEQEQPGTGLAELHILHFSTYICIFCPDIFACFANFDINLHILTCILQIWAYFVLYAEICTIIVQIYA